MNTIRYFRNTAENINDQIYYLDNVNSTISRINNRLTGIENNIELIVENTNQVDVTDTPSSSPNNEINLIN